MTFTALNSSVADLRNGLSAHVSGTALDSVKSRPPTGTNDEASFLRLTTWCYILIFEAGRVSLQYLLKVPPPADLLHKRDCCKQTCSDVNVLRTWFFHNLDFDDQKRKHASQWFLDTCKVNVPIDKKHWRLCFKRLCNDVGELIVYCNDILSRIALSPDDKDIIFPELKRRLERNWNADEFDIIVRDSAARLGESIDAVKFRNKRISSWRQFLDQLPENVDLKKEVTRIIDRDIIDHFRSLLPVTTKDVMEALELTPGERVKEAIQKARTLFESGFRDPNALLEKLVDIYKADQINGS